MIERTLAPASHGVLPVEPDTDSTPYWAALAEGKLRLPRCLRCVKVWSPPAPRCPHCGTTEREWVEVDGGGRVYSWVVVHRALDEAFAADVPYTIAVVELEGADGARLLARVLPPHQPCRAGMRVRTVVYDVEGRSLPGFVAAAEPNGTREGNPA